MTAPTTDAGAVVPSGDLLAGDRVTWTSIRVRGRSMDLTLREGVVVGPCDKVPACVLVKRRGKVMPIHRANLRREGKRSTLDEMVDEMAGRPKANAPRQPRRVSGVGLDAVVGHSGSGAE